MADQPDNRSGGLNALGGATAATFFLLVAGLGGCQVWPGESVICSSLTESECLSSAACTLALDGAGMLACRADRNHCEAMFRQSIGTAQQCLEKADCEYQAAVCYCPPGVECVCGGGDPPTCRAAADPMPVAGREDGH